MRSRILPIFLILAGMIAAFAQGHFRRHTATDSKPLRLVRANSSPRGQNVSQIRVNGQTREVQSNGIPDHKVGRFPNPGNTNEIRPQQHRYSLSAEPETRAQATPAELGPVGVAVNGIPFDPGAAEFWQGDPRSGWNYEALGGAVPLGLDENHAHVQPTGAYHYHGLPTLLLKDLGVAAGSHSPLVGWAADGFPIYALYGFEDPDDATSRVVEMRSSYRLKEGRRPGGDEPDGDYDGAFVQDYEFVPGLGDLDECNGRETVSPEFPQGTYAYFLTQDWPVVPRAMRGEPAKMRGEMPRGPGGRRPPPPPPGKRPPPPPKRR